MKSYRLFVCLIAMLLPGVAKAQGYRWENLTQTDVIQAIRDFEHDPSLVLTFTTPMTGDTGEPDMFAECYLYVLSTNRYEYTVSKFAHVRVTRYDRLFLHHLDNNFYGQPYDPATLKDQVITQDAAVTIARNFMQAHYPHPEVLSQVYVRGDTGDTLPPVNGVPQPTFIETYRVSFSQDCSNGIRGPVYCSVVVDSILGQVVEYNQQYYPVLVPLPPQLSGAQAMQAAMNALLTQPGGQPGGVQSLYVTHPDVFGVQTTLYSLSFRGVGPAGPNETTYVADVDAYSGRLLRWSLTASIMPSAKTARVQSITRGAEKKKQHQISAIPLASVFSEQQMKLTYPLLQMHNQPYIYVGYLCYGAKDVKLTYKGRDHIAVVSPQRNLQFSLNSVAYTCNGQSRQLSAKPVLVEDRCYVPLEAAQGVMPFLITYNADAKQVTFDPVPATPKTTINAPTAASPSPAPNPR